MIPLDYAGTRKLQLITGQNGASVVVGFSDFDTTTKAYDRGVPTCTTISSATTTDICATPASGKIRDVGDVFIQNTYAGSNAMVLQVASGAGGPFIIEKFTLLQDEHAEYAHGTGLQTFDANGQKKTVMPGYLPLTGGTVSGATTFSAALTYGGVTLTNAVTGTGNMVLSASPTLTGTLTAATANWSGLGTFNAGATVASGQTLTLTGATVAGTPTWSSSQAITLSTAAQPNVTSLSNSGFSFGTGTSTTVGLRFAPATGVSSYAAIYPENVTPSTTNYSFLSRYTGGETYINSLTTAGIQVGGTTVISVTAGAVSTNGGSLTAGAGSFTTGAFSGNITLSSATQQVTASSTTGYSLYNNNDVTGYIKIFGGSHATTPARVEISSAGTTGIRLQSSGSDVAVVTSTGLSVTGTLGVTGAITGGSMAFNGANVVSFANTGVVWNGTADLTLPNTAHNFGILTVTNVNQAAPTTYKTSTVYALAHTTGTTFTTTSLHSADGSGGAQAFTVTMPSAGVIRITGNATDHNNILLSASFFGTSPTQ